MFAHYVAASGLTNITANENVIVGGDDDGTIIVIDNENNNSPILTDHPSTTDIRFDLISQVQNFGTLRKKEISERIIAWGEDAEGLKVMVRIDFGDWKTIGEITKKGINEFKLRQTLRGNLFEFRIVGTRTGERPIFKSLVMPHIVALDSY